MKDLVILAADKNIEHALRGLLTRTESLRIRPVDADVFVHPERDPACARRGVEFLDRAEFLSQYRFGLLLFDHEGSGRESMSPQSLQDEINSNFGRSRWGERARAIVLVPEIEAWVWGDSPHVDDVVGWKDRHPGLRRWLRDSGWWNVNESKPKRPKEAFEAALRLVGKPRSSSLYLQIAQRVSLARCEDEAFLELKVILKDWFPPAN